ncbi:branched-chain amino acid ABC transporter permease [Lacrimispora sp. 210928-DFI.3.58]|uniref:branched-chain amino acid ABC transporter permease n=1 Tax=Lacrimispora sp. 210928-DFI.3.58 TaxID=2883214 RepID=UPI0015B46508|nr:branched-chain amino acid ABC transporter permease [Lacrimispora sp. 210928-DFI.3.58]MCB7320352.1 branched-chain amino acid ABC transporter permease [Lacrimispora sp. 210928-DFI.3.58]
MIMFLQALIGGISQGAIYALIALGYSVIYSTLKMGHFAQGEFYMLGAFIGLTLSTRLGLPVVLVFVGAGIITSIVMLGLERITYRPMYNRPRNALLIATLGMQYVVQQIAKIVWGSDVKRFPAMFNNQAIHIPFMGETLAVSPQNLWTISICSALMIALVIFMKKTKTGIAMSAVSMNRKAASLMGVKITTIITATYIIAACLAAVSGVLMGPIYSVSFSMGSSMGNRAMTAAVMGGFGSLPGAMLGGILLGVAETMCSLYISTAYKDVFTFIILIIVLFWRPQGILGQAKITKV